MKSKKLFYLLVLIFLGLAIYSNYRYQTNFQAMIIVGKELRENDFDFDSLFLEKVNTTYPTLTNSTVPLKSIIGASYLKNSSDSVEIKKGLDYLYKARKENPYIGFPEQVLANHYQFRNYNKDSFRYYARKASQILPNNPSHFILMSRIYSEDKKYDSILIYFEDIIKRVPRDHLVWRVFLASMASSSNVVDSIKVINYARQAKQLFRYGTETTSSQVHLLADYVIYGKDNVDEAIKIREEANSLAKELDFEKSEKLFYQLVQSFPDVILYYEDLIAVYWNQKKYKEIINTYVIMREKDLYNIKSNILELVMSSLFIDGKTEDGCILLELLKRNNYPVTNQSLAFCT